MKSIFSLALVLSFAVVSLATAQAPIATESRAKASASLSLAKAQREREAAAVAVAKLHAMDSAEPSATRVKAAAALALARATRERATGAKSECHTDLSKAIAAARKSEQPVILWIGMQCESVPEVRDGLADCVHCHADSYNGNATPRLMALFADGIGGYVMPKADLGEGKEYPVSRIRSLTAKQVEPPRPATKPVVSIEQSFAADCPNGQCPNVQKPGLFRSR